MKEFIIPLAGMFALFVVPAIIGVIAILKWHKGRERQYQLIEDAIDKGAPQEVIDKLVEMAKPKEEKEEKNP